MATDTISEYDQDVNLWSMVADLIDPPKSGNFEPLPHQIPPDLPWRGWLLLGGRGTGKTAASAKYVHDHVHGPPCIEGIPGGHWISIVAPTLGDAVTSCVMGPSGLRLHDPKIRVVNRPGGISAIWGNGVEAKLFGAHSPEDVERFRAGGNRCLVWMEELAAWRYLKEAFEQIRYGLRVGPRPHWIGSTTPKSIKVLKEMMADPKIAVTHGKTSDNPHLNEEVKAELYADYADTRMGRQELAGELLEDVENALWTGEIIELNRLKVGDRRIPDWMDRIAVAIDPAAKSEEGSDETGIIVAGMVHKWDMPGVPHPEKSHAFILQDVSGRLAPTHWGKRAVKAYKQWEADRIVAEINNGGEMVKHVIHSLDDTLPYRPVTATRGKTRRAEPISALYYEGRVHHIGLFPQLEDQMTQWNPDPDEADPSWSPDRMDAMVWAVTDLLIGKRIVTSSTVNDRRLSNRR